MRMCPRKEISLWNNSHFLALRRNPPALTLLRKASSRCNICSKLSPAMQTSSRGTGRAFCLMGGWSPVSILNFIHGHRPNVKLSGANTSWCLRMSFSTSTFCSGGKAVALIMASKSADRQAGDDRSGCQAGDDQPPPLLPETLLYGMSFPEVKQKWTVSFPTPEDDYTH
ncbi:uncharacterized protein LOC117644982 isoform X1 [Thrips palmi]|uniref:Uncharacterized protein LOC117644982 isoform X1 n=1 Tax=Thrips palmi TaxID=161013 RepID=A0A6P8YUD9_THRPL|nr:uncharacterized protein LOC117644982 isoform X1 [Thrips palmi]